MPVEIRELIIKATIVRDEPGSTSGTSGSASGNSTEEALIQECVNQVMDIIKAQENGR
jgi:hypothetical protein